MITSVTESTKNRILSEMKKSILLKLLKEGTITEKEYCMLIKIY